MQMQPSSTMREHFRSKCESKCHKYKYWWAGKASHAAWKLRDYDTCVFECVEDTIEKERPHIFKGSRPDKCQG